MDGEDIMAAGVVALIAAGVFGFGLVIGISAGSNPQVPDADTGRWLTIPDIDKVLVYIDGGYSCRDADVYSGSKFEHHAWECYFGGAAP